MIATVILTAIVVGLPLGYRLWRQALTIDEQADTAASHIETLAAHEGTIAAKQRLIDAMAETTAIYLRDRDWERMLRVIAEAERDTAQTALRGLLTNLARQELIEPDQPAQVADVVEMPVRGVRG